MPRVAGIGRLCIVGGLVLLAAGCSGSPKPALVSSTTPSSECKWSGDVSEWKQIQVDPTEFGVDDLHVDASAPVALDSVVLVNASGIRLTGVMFVQGGGYGEGGQYGDPSLAATPASWARRMNMPGAVLPVGNGGDASADWQAVVGLLPTTADGGSATGIQFNYHVGGQAFSLKGVMSVAVTRTQAGCPTQN